MGIPKVRVFRSLYHSNPAPRERRTLWHVTVPAPEYPLYCPAYSTDTLLYNNYVFQFLNTFLRCLLFILSPRLHHSSPRVYMLGCQQQLLTMNTHALRYAVLHACMLLHCLRVFTLTYACTINSLTISSPTHFPPISVQRSILVSTRLLQFYRWISERYPCLSRTVKQDEVSIVARL